MFTRFSPEAKAAVVSAQREARSLFHDWIGTEHLLLGLMSQPDDPAVQVLRCRDVTQSWVRGRVEEVVGTGLDRDALASLGIDLDEVRVRAEARFGPNALVRRRRCREGSGRFLAFMPRAKRALEFAARELDERGETSLNCGHLLCGILREVEGVGAQILAEAGVTLDGVRAARDAEPPPAG
ncbi:MAG: Clp protease [Actinomycetota bacterium]|nr:Clp protease [Actinomycetota bacterium]